MIGRQAAPECYHALFGLRARDAVGPPSHQEQPGEAAVARLALGQAERPEQVAPAQVAPVVERGRQHADDLVRLAVDAYAASDDLRIAREAVAPVPVADDQHAV